MEDLKRSFKGVWIPKEIWISKELTLQEKVFLVEIDSLDNDIGCTAGNKYFADFFNMSERRVCQLIKLLKEKNYLSISYAYKKGTKEIEYRIIKIQRPPYPNMEVVKNSSIGVVKDFSIGTEENCVDNNIDNNNIYNISYSKFKKPTAEQINSYCKEIGVTIDANYFIDFYEARGWLISGKTKMKDWKATIRNWARRKGQSINKKNKKEIKNDIQQEQTFKFEPKELSKEQKKEIEDMLKD